MLQRWPGEVVQRRLERVKVERGRQVEKELERVRLLQRLQGLVMQQQQG